MILGIIIGVYNSLPRPIKLKTRVMMMMAKILAEIIMKLQILTRRNYQTKKDFLITHQMMPTFIMMSFSAFQLWTIISYMILLETKAMIIMTSKKKDLKEMIPKNLVVGCFDIFVTMFKFYVFENLEFCYLLILINSYIKNQ